MNSTPKALFALLICFIFTGRAQSQAVDLDNMVRVKLKDGTSVTLVSKWVEDSPSKAYYYLPLNLRLSKVNDREQEYIFSFVKVDEQDPNTQSLITFALEWGLTSTQEEELKSIMKEGKQSIPLNTVLMGALENYEHAEAKIISSVIQNYQLSHPPTRPGQRLLGSAILSEMATKIFEAFIKGGLNYSDLSVQLEFFARSRDDSFTHVVNCNLNFSEAKKF